MYNKIIAKFRKKAVIDEPVFTESTDRIVVTDKKLRKKMMKRAKRALKRINKENKQT